MKRFSVFLILSISTISVFAQNAVVQDTPVVTPQQDFWTAHNLWVLIISFLLTGFILLVVYSLAHATIALSKQVEKRTK